MQPTLDRSDFLRHAALLAAPPPRGRDRHGLVTGHPEGAAAGLAVLAAGGTAVDAIVTAALVAGVVQVEGCGIAGYGGDAVVATAPRRATAIHLHSPPPPPRPPRPVPLG